uniref:Uncharacterized protein n=1 Tax=Chelydra serpentina TaxID=8475 RepID=A0A8C3THA3_CHESE
MQCAHQQLPASPPTPGHPIDIAHSSLELPSDPPTAASQAAGITGTHYHTAPLHKYIKNMEGPQDQLIVKTRTPTIVLLT